MTHTDHPGQLKSINSRTSRLAILLFVLASAHFCSGQSGDTRMVVYRPKSLLSCALTATLMIDDTIRVKLRNGEQQIVVLPLGVHQVRTRKSSFTVSATDTAYLRLFYDYNMLFGRVLVTEVTAQTAEAERFRLRKEFAEGMKIDSPD